MVAFVKSFILFSVSSVPSQWADIKPPLFSKAVLKSSKFSLFNDSNNHSNYFNQQKQKQQEKQEITDFKKKVNELKKIKTNNNSIDVNA